MSDRFKQPTKLGYVNNPNWVERDKATHVHTPCGYWYEKPLANAPSPLWQLPKNIDWTRPLYTVPEELPEVVLPYVSAYDPDTWDFIGIVILSWNLTPLLLLTEGDLLLITPETNTSNVSWNYEQNRIYPDEYRETWFCGTSRHNVPTGSYSLGSQSDSAKFTVNGNTVLSVSNEFNPTFVVANALVCDMNSQVQGTELHEYDGNWGSPEYGGLLKDIHYESVGVASGAYIYMDRVSDGFYYQKSLTTWVDSVNQGTEILEQEGYYNVTLNIMFSGEALPVYTSKCLAEYDWNTHVLTKTPNGVLGLNANMVCRITNRMLTNPTPDGEVQLVMAWEAS